MSWAASGAGVTGGSAAAAEQVYVVANRGELIAALNNGVVSSTSPAVPPTNRSSSTSKAPSMPTSTMLIEPLTCSDYYANGYTPEGFPRHFFTILRYGAE